MEVLERPSPGVGFDCGKTRNVVEIGQVISGKYKLIRLLGDGGMGSVYEAEHLTLGTHVAIKVLHGDLARRPGISERFLQEARVSAQIKSPHVVQVVDVDRTPEGVAYLVMELLQGEPLASAVKRERKLSVPVACAYATQILQALEAAHALGVIHRDLKPDNVFVTFQGGKPVLKLIDFGIAKLKTAQAGQTKNLTVAGMLMGTPEYMAPEQAYSAAEVDVRADLYAVGVMLYEMLAGQPPVTADDPRVLILKVERGEVTPLVQVVPGIQPEIAGFVHRAMAPRPELRFANATEMRIALDDVMSGKRPPTAKLSITPMVPVASVAPVPPAIAPVAPLGETADANANASLKTGTVMGAPVESALAGPPVQASMAAPIPGGTSFGPAPPHMGPPHGFQHPPRGLAQPQHASQRPPGALAEPKRGMGLIIGLAVVALLLGAGAVVTYVSSTQSSTPTVPTVDIPTATAATTTPTATATTVSVTPVTPLTGPTHTGATTTPPGPGPTLRPTGRKDGGAPQAQVDAGSAPAVQDAGAGQTLIVTPFGTFQFPGPRPPLWPADQPWPPPNPVPLPGQ
jgi:serine/threonine-protein kinase